MIKLKYTNNVSMYCIKCYQLAVEHKLLKNIYMWLHTNPSTFIPNQRLPYLDSDENIQSVLAALI